MKKIIIKIIIGFLGFLLFDVIAAFGIMYYFDKYPPFSKTEVFDKDYIVIYKSVLDEKFKNWRVSNTKKIKDGPLPYNSDLGSLYVEYIEWEITYKNANDETKIFILDNRKNIDEQLNSMIDNTEN